MTDNPDSLVERDPYEVANQLSGYIGSDTEAKLASFLWRESREAAKIAAALTAKDEQIARLEAERTAAIAAAYRKGLEDAAAFLRLDAELCDCFALESAECACGAWDDYKTVAMTDLIDRFETHFALLTQDSRTTHATGEKL